MIADEGDPVRHPLDAKRHSETSPEMFLESGRSAKALGAMNDLRKTAGPGVDAGPALTAAPKIFADADQCRPARRPAEGKRRPEQAAELYQHPAYARDLHLDNQPAVKRNVRAA